jgi:hypothetical protein
MTRPEKYQELIAAGKTPINCAPDHGHPSKLLCSIDEHGNVLLYCSHCHKDRVLKYTQITAIREHHEHKQAQANGDDPIKQLMRDMSAWMSTVLPSYDTGNASYSMDVEEAREKLQARVRIVLSGGVA